MLWRRENLLCLQRIEPRPSRLSPSCYTNRTIPPPVNTSYKKKLYHKSCLHSFSYLHCLMHLFHLPTHGQSCSPVTHSHFSILGEYVLFTIMFMLTAKSVAQILYQTHFKIKCITGVRSCTGAAKYQWSIM
jgi:hypothetical protein